MLSYVDKFNLWHIIDDELSDDIESDRERHLVKRGNEWIRRFTVCTNGVKCCLLRASLAVIKPMVDSSGRATSRIQRVK